MGKREFVSRPSVCEPPREGDTASEAWTPPQCIRQAGRQEGKVDAAYLHDLVLELGQEEVDDLVLLDGQRVQVDLLHALDLAGLYETAQLGDGLPLLLLALAAATSTATTASTSTIAATTVAETTTTGTASVSHGLM